MAVLVLLVPVSLGLGLLGLAAFLWTLRTRQYDDPEGDAARILSDRWDDRPAPPDPVRDTPPAPDEEKRR
ncbi:cytochrome oxidase maturation protein, cbb3-type [Rubellimicrobium thermophilum DSM 16684]|uniref:Cytochrome oxidase maturation protein, cbb3-type n=1 Tax=Rubellimicrobium thermophilum DSM 16684 TaxID=1123069 RepID=S9SHH9_9RHOB|nr:cbb3-type cytochrome oxidase assembly protein CcoS [Rubellimicrobium thermophilum]EPX85769.1 cytochrome oxidase maturation protein, cbb3-type [Rubellimicrobium thermophilum DSM 16684]